MRYPVSDPCPVCGNAECRLPVRHDIVPCDDSTCALEHWIDGRGLRAHDPCVHDPSMRRGMSGCYWCGEETIPGRSAMHVSDGMMCEGMRMASVLPPEMVLKEMLEELA